MLPDYDVVVVGGGHAGCEAALAAARLGARTLLVTLNLDTIAKMPCNCSIGGPGKAHLVREIDALGGEMARAIDRTFTHIRLLNASRGTAVRALRAQADTGLYGPTMRAVLEATSGLALLEDEVEGVRVSGGAATGVHCREHGAVGARAVVVCPGTFLNGRMHMGAESWDGGRLGERAVSCLAGSLRSLGHETMRFKTGTTPRVRLESLDLQRTAVQPSDARPWRFSAEAGPRPPWPLLAAYKTHTNECTHEVLRANADQSALWSGRISGTGPRYCPSIEAKLLRFPERRRHMVFLEIEGWSTDQVYVQGLSNSLSPAAQQQMLHTIAGLERASVTVPGYAVEYDVVSSIGLGRCLESTRCAGLYLAGQVNGTSGYEEAAAQGLVAGVAAARRAFGEAGPDIDRKSSYVGVLLDDLRTHRLDEPYRMLTARVEARLALPADDVWRRLRLLTGGVAVPGKVRCSESASETPKMLSRRAFDPFGARMRIAAAEASARMGTDRNPGAEPIPGLHVLPAPEGVERLPLRLEARERIRLADAQSLAELLAVPGLTPADKSTIMAAARRAADERAGGRAGPRFT